MTEWSRVLGAEKSILLSTNVLLGRGLHIDRGLPSSLSGLGYCSIEIDTIKALMFSWGGAYILIGGFLPH